MSNNSIKDKISQKLNKENVKSFFHKQGLYVLIFLCVVAAGITAIIAWPRDNTEQIGDKNQGAAVIEGPSLSDEIAAQKTPVVTVSPLPSASPAVSATPPSANQPSKVLLTKPIKGQVINKYSGDNHVSFPSLGMWMTHNGVDIKAEKGASVGAALGGTVIEVSSDDANGGMVVISHSGDAITVYSGLDNIIVKKDDKVSAGQKIGEIGEMPKELDLSYHLHFEYKVGSIWKDPEKYWK
jgi:murein DD-endopeptidase MepM/ murein hydrolase activator NlpD